MFMYYKVLFIILSFNNGNVLFFFYVRKIFLNMSKLLFRMDKKKYYVE